MTSANYSNGKTYTYTYDKVGNRTSQMVNGQTTAYTYDELNRLAIAGGVSFSWDANGNLLNDGINAYTYDKANRLTALSGQGLSYSFAYDGLGNRYQQTANGETTTFLLDLAGDLSQVLYDDSTAYFYGLERLAQQVNGGDCEYFLPDRLGSVRQVAGPSGFPSFAQDFDPFGNLIAYEGLGESSYGFTGELGDPSGLTYLRARFYSPAQGRFITRDPFPGYMDRPASFNPYSYALNNPVLYTDPSGENPLFLLVGAVGGLIGGSIYGYGSQVIRNLGQGMCFWAALSTDIDAGHVALYAGVGTILGLGWGGVIIGAKALLSYLGIGTTIGTTLSADGDPTNEIRTGINVVYQVVHNGVTKYIGITNNFIRRAGEHLRSGKWIIEPIQGLENLSRSDAKAVEQVLIEKFGLMNLYNQINSISPNNPIYSEAIKRGLEILRKIGY